MCFEVFLEKNLNISGSSISSEISNPHEVRIGFSVREASTRLGDERDSYCYCSTGHKREENRSTSFGRPYHAGDKIGAYADLSSPNVAEFFFTLNGNPLGCAFKVRKMPNTEYYPHIYLKNMRCSINFGDTSQKDSTALNLLPGFKLINHADGTFLKRGILPPTKPELIMTVGLPGCGKTTFSKNYAFDHPEKRYNVLSTDFIIELMCVGDASRRDFVQEREKLCMNRENFTEIDLMTHQAAGCFSKLMKIAMNRCRNYILDQTNIFASSRTEKARAFTSAGFRVVSAIIAVSYIELQRRSKQRTERTGKSVPTSAINELMANFFLPVECKDNARVFNDCMYVDSNLEDAKQFVKDYRRIANEAGCTVRFN